MFKPLNDYVLLELLAEENKTQGGIIIPDTAAEKPSRGRVIATEIGNIGKSRALCIKPGDTVLFAKWAPSASEVRLDGRDYVLVKETDILGIL